MEEQIGKLPAAIGASAITALTLLYVVNHIAKMNLAPEPGDPFYPAWAANLDAMSVVIPMLVVGVPTVALVVLAGMSDGFGGR